MAQHYYDFYLARPGQWPVCIKGKVPENSGLFYSFICPAFLGSNGRRSFIKMGIQGETTSHHSALGLSVADFDIIYETALSPQPASSAFANAGPCSFWARIQGFPEGNGWPTGGYLFTNAGATTLASTGGQRNLRLYKRSNDAWTVLANADNYLPVPLAAGGQEVMMRFQGIGSTLRTKAWMRGEPEPESWLMTVNDTEFAGGDIGVSFWGYGQRVTATSIAIGTEGDPPPPPPPLRAVSGTVLTPNGDPAIGYLVNLHDQETGVLLDSSVTNSSGGFSFATTNAGAVYVVAIDQLGNSWRAPIVDRIIPATI